MDEGRGQLDGILLSHDHFLSLRGPRHLAQIGVIRQREALNAQAELLFQHAEKPFGFCQTRSRPYRVTVRMGTSRMPSVG